jgi:hypothetical protein
MNDKGQRIDTRYKLQILDSWQAFSQNGNKSAMDYCAKDFNA